MEISNFLGLSVLLIKNVIALNQPKFSAMKHDIT